MKTEPAEMERTREVELEHLEGFKFRIDFGGEIPSVTADEPPPLGEGSGPDASRLLAGAIGNCLSASLMLCLQKSRADVRSLRTHVTLTIERNEEKRLRVAGGRVRITLEAGAETAKLERCFGIFESYCTVTASIRNAFPVDVEVVDPQGVTMYASAPEPGAAKSVPAET